MARMSNQQRFGPDIISEPSDTRPASNNLSATIRKTRLIFAESSIDDKHSVLSNPSTTIRTDRISNTDRTDLDVLPEPSNNDTRSSNDDADPSTLGNPSITMVMKKLSQFKIFFRRLRRIWNMLVQNFISCKKEQYEMLEDEVVTINVVKARKILRKKTTKYETLRYELESILHNKNAITRVREDIKDYLEELEQEKKYMKEEIIKLNKKILEMQMQIEIEKELLKNEYKKVDEDTLHLHEVQHEHMRLKIQFEREHISAVIEPPKTICQHLSSAKNTIFRDTPE